MSSRKWFAGAGLIVAVSLALIGCGSPKPGATVKAWTSAMNSGEYSKVEQFLSKNMLAQSKEAGGTDAIKMMADMLTKNGQMTELEVTSETITDDRANVKFTVHYKDGSTEPGDVNLIKEDGSWKVNF